MNTHRYTHTSRLLRRAVQVESRVRGVVIFERGTLRAEADDVVNELSEIAMALHLSIPNFDYNTDHDDEIEELKVEIQDMHCTDLVRVMEHIGIAGLANGVVTRLYIRGE